jgi:hypothetical protein
MVSINPRKFYEVLLSQMPDASLERAMLRILSFHIGKNHAISKPQLLRDLGRSGFHVSERQARGEIVELRKHGHLICSSSGDGGYYIAETNEEYEEFAQVEYRAKIIDMSETLRAMDDGAGKFFQVHEMKQASLF